LPRMLRRALSEWLEDNASRLGAALAFYSLLSLAPVIVIAVALAAVFYGHAAAEGRLASEIAGVAGPEAARTIQEIIKGGYQPRIGVIATLLGLATLTFGASSVFLELHDSMNTIWHVSLPSYRNNDATVIRLIRERSGHRFAAAGLSDLERLDGSREDYRTGGCHMDHFVSADSGAICGSLQNCPGRRTEMERRGPGSRDHLDAFHGRQGVDWTILRACQLRVDV
jgi:hypothetical protein